MDSRYVAKSVSVSSFLCEETEILRKHYRNRASKKLPYEKKIHIIAGKCSIDRKSKSQIFSDFLNTYLVNTTVTFIDQNGDTGVSRF